MPRPPLGPRQPPRPRKAPGASPSPQPPSSAQSSSSPETLTLQDDNKMTDNDDSEWQRLDLKSRCCSNNLTLSWLLLFLLLLDLRPPSVLAVSHLTRLLQENSDQTGKYQTLNTEIRIILTVIVRDFFIALPYNKTLVDLNRIGNTEIRIRTSGKLEPTSSSPVWTKNMIRSILNIMTQSKSSGLWDWTI